MMGLKSLAAGLWLFHCLSIVFAVSREFPGDGYLKYDILKPKNKAINSDVDTLSLQFKTIQPTGLLFHTQNSGDKLGDHVTLELVGGRLRLSMQLGARVDLMDTKEVFLGKDLSDGRTHRVDVSHKRSITTVTLDAGSSQSESREIKTRYKKLDIDIAIYVGGASSYKNLQGIQSNVGFTGCLTDVNFNPENDNVIKFLDKGVADSVKVDMDKGCSELPAFQPYTFYDPDSAFTFTITKKDAMTGSFKFRTYKRDGELLKQDNQNNGFVITYGERDITLKLTIKGTATDVSLSYNIEEPKVNGGNWHNIEFSISATTISLSGDNKTPATKPPGGVLPTNFFTSEVTAGGFIGCMRDLKINNLDKKPIEGVSKINKLEVNKCNITDLCIFSPCLNKGRCFQDGKRFTCECTGSGYLAPVCQFPEFLLNCDALKRRYLKAGTTPIDDDYTLDIDGPGPLKATKLPCNMTANPAITGVKSEELKVKIITGDKTGTVEQAFVEDITYNPDIKVAKALAMNSGTCKQYIEFGCKKARLLNAGESQKLGHWVSTAGVYQNYWGGAPPTSESCACGVNNTCQPNRNKKCNCDAGENIWRKDGGWLTATADLPVTQVVFYDVNNAQGSEANFTVGNLYCTGNVTNTATFINEDGMIKLDKWGPPSDGVISLFFRTPYPKGTLLYNGVMNKDFFRLEIVNETSISLNYDIGNGIRRIELSLKDNKKVNDRQWHEVVIFRNMKEFGLMLDTETGVNLNPVFLEKDLNVESDLHVGGYPFDVSQGFVGCIRGLTINGEVIDLNKKAENADYVKGGCGAACEKNFCKLFSKCVDDYNVYKCDCSLTPFYGYFCSLDRGASFAEKDSQLTYTYPDSEVQNVPGVDIVVGFKVNSADSCGGDIIRITGKGSDDFFLLSLNSNNKKLKFSYKTVQGDGSFEIDPPDSDFCDGNRHTFALSRRNEKVNYTVDGKSKPETKESRLSKPFSRMQKIQVGKIGSTGFKGCLTGVKVTPFGFGEKYRTVQPIDEYIYDGKTTGYEASDINSNSKEKCGPEPEVPEEIPTPRDVGVPAGGVQTTAPHDPTSGRRTESDNETAIIVVVVLILVLLLVVLVIVIYWYWARHKGEYHTHEDDEELKSADPYIDMTATKKPLDDDTEKKKEWYI